MTPPHPHRNHGVAPKSAVVYINRWYEVCVRSRFGKGSGSVWVVSVSVSVRFGLFFFLPRYARDVFDNTVFCIHLFFCVKSRVIMSEIPECVDRVANTLQCCSCFSPSPTFSFCPTAYPTIIFSNSPPTPTKGKKNKLKRNFSRYETHHRHVITTL